MKPTAPEPVVETPEPLVVNGHLHSSAVQMQKLVPTPVQKSSLGRAAAHYRTMRQRRIFFR